HNWAIWWVWPRRSLRRQRSVRVVVATHAMCELWREQMDAGIHDARVDLTKRRDVIKDPERPPVGADNKILLMNHQIANRGCRQIQAERLPVVPVVEREVDCPFGAGEQQSFKLGIFANRVYRLVVGDS